MENDRANDFWRGFVGAVEAVHVDAQSIQGASGIHHPILSAGLDRGRRRLIVISAEKEPLGAAFAQADLQAAFQPVRIILARAAAAPSPEDVEMGLCPVPLEEFTPHEIEVISTGTELEEAQAVLRRHQILQYFFPAPDHLTLGLIESGRIHFLPQMIDQLVRIPDLGHPFGPTEIIERLFSFTEMLKELQNLGLVEEGEKGLKVSEAGLGLRAAVRERPREGLLFKALNQYSANLFLKPLLHPRP